MNRSARRAQYAAAANALVRENAKWPKHLVEVPRGEWPSYPHKLIRVLRSREFLVQVFGEDAGIIRLSVNRARLLSNGRWDDGISWDDLQRLKSEAGYGRQWAVEVFPCDYDVVNVANMRHLWVLERAPHFAWRQLSGGNTTVRPLHQDDGA